MNGYQNAFEIFLGIQKSNHIFHNKPLLCYVLIVFSQSISVISAYKDPVKNQHIKNTEHHNRAFWAISVKY